MKGKRTMSGKKINITNVEFQPATGRQIAEIASAAVSGAKTVTCRIVEIFPEGQVGPRAPHSHDIEEVIYVIDGQGRVWLEGEEIEFAAGELVVIPIGSKHRIINPGINKLTLLCVFPAANVEIP